MSGAGRLILPGALAALAGCAATDMAAREGTAGPVTWRAEDVGVVTREIEGKVADAYTFTLVVSNVGGAPITFTKLEATVSEREIFLPSPVEATATWRLFPGQQWRLPLPFSIQCPHLPGACPVSQTVAPVWRIRLTGRTADGQPLELPITVSLPPATIRSIFK